MDLKRGNDVSLKDSHITCDWQQMDEYISKFFGKGVRVHSLLRSAVTVPLLSISGRPAVLLVEKKKDLPVHGGQVAFPGGKKEPHDASPVDTALREFTEETGLPPDALHVVGVMEPELTYTTGYVIVPVVGIIERADLLKRIKVDNNEISRVVLFFLDGADGQGLKFNLETLASDLGFSLLYPEFELESGLKIWGATGRILFRVLANSKHFFQGARECQCH